MSERHDPGAELPAGIGPYRVLRLLGEGGMGRVYLAEQRQPQREIALKVVRTAASGEVLQRFQREAELLAGLEHPAIARIYTTGVAETAGGPVPYLAMEFIRGTELLAYAEAQALDLRARLQLMAELCRAVHYAHARGVIHRDLKPGNVLVDASGQPRILDFGVACALGGEAYTRMTMAGEILGTLPYMSWEQMVGDTARIDVRSDVYSLGVMTYELLAGRLPYPDLPKATLLGAIETLRREEPPRLGRVAPAAAGDPETIVMKALAREPSQRYDSAAEMAADLERYLARQPITARPPTARYVLGLFVRRHKALATGAGLALAALIAATLVSLQFAWSEARARADAEWRLQEREATHAFLTDMLSAADPARARGEEVTMREVLGSARMVVERRQDLPDSVRASVLQTLGGTYAHLGVPDQALDLLQQARTLMDRSTPADARDRLALEYEYINALTLKGDQTQALQLASAALAHLQASADREAWPVYWKLRLVAAYARSELGEIDAAYADVVAIHAALVARYGEADALTLEAAQQWAALERLRGDYRAAVRIADSIVRLRTQTLGADHPETLHSRNGLATHYGRLGDYVAAEMILREVLADRQRVLGEDHSDVWRTQQNLAVVLLDSGKTAEGARLMRGLVEKFAARHGEQHRETLRLMNNLATAERDLKNLPAGESLLRRVIEAQRVLPPSQHEDLYLAEINLAINLQDQQRLDESLRYFRSGWASAQRGLPEAHPNVAVIRFLYGEALYKRRQFAAAIAELEPAYRALVDKLGGDHPRTRKARETLRATYTALGRTAEAAALAERPTP